MNEALEKTQQLERTELPVTALVPNPANPNVMHDAEFNKLCDNIGKVGFTDAILVRDLGDGTYRIVGGHHRWEAAKHLGFEKVPVVINRDPLFDDEAEEFQLVRHNVIRGQLSATKFLEMYAKYAKKYSAEVLQDAFGFSDREAFQKLIETTRAGLPKELKGKFTEAVKEIKTIDGLAKILNQLFAQYKDTLPWNYMVFDYLGKQSIWIRCHPAQLEALQKLGSTCQRLGVSLDSAMNWLIAHKVDADEIAKLPQNSQVITELALEDPLNQPSFPLDTK